MKKIATKCIYCGRLVQHEMGDVPEVSDTAAWERIAQLGHGEYCEWVLSRAHRVDGKTLRATRELAEALAELLADADSAGVEA